jgi:negative regulator of sigma-B (phosphoserine phosphatase)
VVALTVDQPVERRPALLEWGVAAAPLKGQRTSGDLHLFLPLAEGALIAAVDGLGHGPDAASAAERAVETLRRNSGQSVMSMMRLCHKALIGTRGVAMSVAAISAIDESLTWLAIGNVEAVLLRADARTVPPREAVVMRGGVIGYELPPLRAAVTTLQAGDLLILATDGIDASFTDQLDVARTPQRLADHILAEHAKGTDDALVLVARYLGRPPTRT